MEKFIPWALKRTPLWRPTPTQDAVGAPFFTEAFKSEAIECCLQLGVSIAAVARAYDL
ncbi:transposase [Parapusillimonas granuli]|uniref:Transposase n=1 Tax=Parapusillimonas granuli TaxID=380911 RepID=A0A853G3K2_9BURK|nr:transposase [Parapusillimonas granuli]MBB5217637.1 transposase-like protein [Parapusillimonas granuli]NYT51938.1 transposase [Parapusillimonas granuli]